MISTVPYGSCSIPPRPGSPVPDPAAAGKLWNLEHAVLAAGPPLDAFRREPGFCGCAGRIGQPCLERRAIEIVGKRSGDGLFLLDHHLVQRKELLLSPFHIAGAAAGEGPAEPGNGLRNPRGWCDCCL